MPCLSLAGTVLPMNTSPATIPLFASLAQDEHQAIFSRFRCRVYPRNTTIIAEGDDSNCLYFIDEGQVKVFVGDDEGREMLLNILGPGDYFGELALLDASPRSASVMTLERSRVRVMSGNDLLDCLQSLSDDFLVTCIFHP